MSLGPSSYAAGGADETEARLFRTKPWMSALTAALLVLTAYLLYRTLSHYSLEEIVRSIKAVPHSRLAFAGCFAAASYLCLTGFDWLALKAIGRTIPYPKIALASFLSLSLGHSIGLSGLSSGAIRYRFYARWGLSVAEVAKVIFFCGIMVGLGLIAFGGIALLTRPDLAQGIIGLSHGTIMAIGIGCLAVCVLYIALPFVAKESIGYRTWRLEVPSPSIAVAQVLIGTLNFACVAACLQQTILAMSDVDYFAVATVYVIANATTILTHVPGGLGVIESVVILLLPGANLIGAVLAFRFVYYLAPLGIGAILFGIVELVFRRMDARREGSTS